MTRVHERTQCKSCVALQFFRPFVVLGSAARGAFTVRLGARGVQPGAPRNNAHADTRVVRMVGRRDSRRRSRVRVTAFRSLRAQRNRIVRALPDAFF
jgi:hypothetical protein